MLKLKIVPGITFIVLLLVATVTFMLGSRSSGFYDNLWPNLFTLSLEGILFVFVFEIYRNIQENKRKILEHMQEDKQKELVKFHEMQQRKKVLALFSGYFNHLFIMIEVFKGYKEKSDLKMTTNYDEIIDWAIENYDDLPFDDIHKEIRNISGSIPLLLSLVSQLGNEDLVSATSVLRNLGALTQTSTIDDVKRNFLYILTFLKGLVP